MFGSVVRFRLRDGVSDEEVAALAEQMESDRPETGVALTVLRERDNPSHIWVVGAFESEEAYRRNAETPEQNERFERVQALIDGPPEWHDGDVLATVHRDAPQATSV